MASTVTSRRQLLTDSMGQQDASLPNYIRGSLKIIQYVIAIYIAIIAFHSPFIQQKLPDVSPHAVVYSTVLMNAFIILIFVYAVYGILMEISAGRNNGVLDDLRNTVSLLFGFLPLIPLLFILIKPFGWFVLSLWIICLACFVCKYFHYLKTLCKNAVEHIVQALREFRQTLVDWNRRRMIRNEEAGNIELQPQNLNISNDKRATEDQIHTSVTAELEISIPDE